MEDLQMENILEPLDSAVTIFNISESFNSLQISVPERPAISIIIPLYNAEKYVSETLDNLLEQTFQDFEVIVVDDCSTDNSVKVVKSYMSKFKKRLHITKTKKNSGGCSVPRNVGLPLAHGEYIFFMDSDDILTGTGLEEMYTLAKEYKADVVYCEKYYMSTGIGKEFVRNIHLAEKLVQSGGFVDKPTFISNDLSERLDELLDKRFWVTAWLRFISHDLISKNNITFPEIFIGEDAIWSFKLLCCAKNFLRVPNVCYVRRMYDESLTKINQKSPGKYIHQWADVMIRGLKLLSDFMDGFEFFRDRPDYRYQVFRRITMAAFNSTYSTYSELNPEEIYNIFMTEFSEDTGEHNVLISFLCTAICEKNKELKDGSKKIKWLMNASQKEKELINKQSEEIKQLKNEIDSMSSLPAPRSTGPAISVIIPMYDVENYVSECLDSILAQTFQDFEVILVDDCSTDNSVKIVESYIPKFDGRLTIVHMKENAGYAGFPRNKGIEFSRGEYLYFCDPDDAITPTALEELYTAAKNFDADVVHCEKYYCVPDEFWHDDEYRKKLKPFSWPNTEKTIITQPTLLTNDLEERVKDFSTKWLQWASWMQFIRRDFLIDSGIRFLNIYSQDMVFVMCELCCAKNYLVVPNVVYYWRKRSGSKTTEPLTEQQAVHRYISTLKQGMNYLDEFLNGQEFFAKRTDLKYILFDTLTFPIYRRLDRLYSKGDAYKLDELLRKELENDRCSAFSAFIFNAMNTHRLPNAPKQLPDFNLSAKQSQKLVSVIIPLYNAEKYIGECLDSILAQTFQDFEVIVVDDCSTDNSVRVVESYMSKFNGRLRLTKTEKNTGSPGDPGNLGVALSRGEYLFILDNDDTITPDALEKLYTTAKKFYADVVTCEKFYWVPEESWYDTEFRKNLKPFSYQKGGLVREPTLVPFNVAKRVQDCYDRRFLWSLWQKLIRRDFLIENDIRFTNNIFQDMVATCCLAYTAKRLVRVPYAVNYYRVSKSSLYRQKREPADKLKTYLKVLHVGFKYLNDFLNKREFFQQNPKIKRIALDTYLKEVWDPYIREVYDKIPVHERNEALLKEFSGDDKTILTEFLSYISNDLSKPRHAVSKIPDKFSAYLTARIDVEYRPKTIDGKLQTFSVSDSEAKFFKPGWFKKTGTYYVINSCTGKLEVVTKATEDGKIMLNLKGMDVRDSKDNSKRIPYWIDYTSLIVNGKVILSKLTPTWHDKPYSYNMDLKANEEIKIEVEWLPHRSET